MTWLRVLLSILAVSTLAACASSTPPISVATDAPIVTVTMSDFALALNPSTLTAGSYRFYAVNAGKTAHVLVLVGPGVAEQRSPVLQPGQTTELAAALQAGEYEMYCPVDGHRDRGMEIRISVGAETPAPSSGGTGGY